MAPDAGDYLPKILADRSPLPVRYAEDGRPLGRGEVNVAPPDRHLLVEPMRMRVVRGPRENRFRPAIDPTFRSAAWAYGPRVVGVLLSGMLNDGSAGLWAIKSCGGVAVVQDPRDARFSDMPRNAIESLPVDYCRPVAELGALVTQLTQQRAPAAATFHAADQLRIETGMTSKTERSTIDELNRIGKLSPFTCPSCHGSLWEIDDEHVLRFRCHTGHGFTAESLAGETDEDLENALFGALRALEENSRLARTIAGRSRHGKHDVVARLYEDKADDNDHSAEVIRAVLDRVHRDAEKR
jgi:two-component system chemotaxis response regulator CheB